MTTIRSKIDAKDKVFLDNKNYYKNLMKFAYPVIISIIIFISYRIADTVMAAYFVSYSTSSGSISGGAILGLTNPIMTIGYSINMLVLSGMQYKYYHAFGNENYEEAEKIIDNGVMGLIILSITVSIFTAAIAAPYMNWIGKRGVTSLPEQAIQQGTMYLYALSIYMIIQDLDSLYFPLLRMEKKNFAIAWLPAAGSIVNIFLDWIFMGIVGTGLVGAGYALIISNAFTWFTFTSYYKFRTHNINYKFTWKLRIIKNYSYDKIFGVFKLGSIAFVRQIGYIFALFIIIITFTGFHNEGTINTPNFTNTNDWRMFITLMSIVYPFFWWLPVSFGSAGASFSAYNYGAKNESNIKLIWKISFIYIISSQILILLIFFLLTPVIWGLVNPQSMKMTSYIRDAYFIMICSFAFYGIQYAYNNAFSSLHDVKNGVLTSILRYFVVFPLFIIPTYLAYWYTPSGTNVFVSIFLVQAIFTCGWTTYLFHRILKDPFKDGVD